MEHSKRHMSIIKIQFQRNSSAVGFYAYKGKHCLFYETVNAGDYCKI